VFGDMGLDHESDATVASLAKGIAAQKFQFLMHMGDIACTHRDPLQPALLAGWSSLSFLGGDFTDTYGGGITNQTRLDAFMNKIEPLAASTCASQSPP